MNTTVEEVGKCPHCKGRKVRETMNYKVNPYPLSQAIMGLGGAGQMESKTKITIYCTQCFTIFKQ